MRDESLIGQIHACPKCGGMVALVPPAESENGLDSVSTGETVSLNPAAGPPLESPESPPVAGAPLGDGDGAEPTPGDLATSIDETLRALRPNAAPGGSIDETIAAQDSTPPAAATSRWVAIAVSAGVASVALVATAVTLLQQGDPALSGAASVAHNSPAVDQPEALTTALKPSLPPDDPAPVERGAETGAEAPPPDHEASEPVPPLPALPELPTADAAASPPTGAEPPRPQPAPAPIAAEPPATTVAPRVFDPLDFDPAALDLILTRGDSETESQPPAAARPQADPLADLDARLASNTPAAAPLAGIDQRLGQAAQDARAVVRRGPTGPFEAPNAPLEIVIPEIQLADAPLDRVYRLLGRIAAAPITIDPGALRYTGVPADAPVSLRGQNATIGELLDQVSRPRLEVVEGRGGGLVVARAGADRERTAAYPVDDLGAADAVAEVISTLLPDLPARLRGVDGKLEVVGPAAAHMEIAILCERLRKARRLSARSRYPRELLRTEPAMARLAGRLGRRTTFTFVEYTPLSEVIDHWRRASGLLILVDWRSLAEEDLGPASTIACGVNSRPWGGALDAVLGGLGLSWRPVDGRTIQVTTQRAASESTTIEFYPAAPGPKAEALQRAIAIAGDADLFYDQATRMLIVNASGATHRAAWDWITEQSE